MFVDLQKTAECPLFRPLTEDYYPASADETAEPPTNYQVPPSPTLSPSPSLYLSLFYQQKTLPVQTIPPTSTNFQILPLSLSLSFPFYY